MPGQLVRKLELTGHATLNKTLPGQLQLNAERWNINGTRMQNVVLSLRGNAQQHQLLLKNDGKQLNSKLNLSGSWQNGILARAPAGQSRLAVWPESGNCSRLSCCNGKPVR